MGRRRIERVAETHRRCGTGYEIGQSRLALVQGLIAPASPVEVQEVEGVVDEGSAIRGHVLQRRKDTRPRRRKR